MSDPSTERSRSITTHRRDVLAAAVGGLTAGALASGTVAGQDGDGSLTLIHDTHFHGRFQDAGQPTKDIVAYDALVRRFREAHGNALFVGNGDDLAPSVLGLEYEGSHMVEALNEMGPAVVGAGNHEFDFGVDVASDRFRESEFPWVAANLLTPEGDPVPSAERWTTVDVGDHTVGVFGLGSAGFHEITDYPSDWQVLDPVEAAGAAVDALRADGADFVVLASHVGTDAHPRIAGAVDGLDAIVGSHSDVTFEEPRVESGTVIAEFGDEFDHVGRLTFDPDSGDLQAWERVDLYDSEALEEDESPPGGDHDAHTAVDVHELEADPDLRSLVDGYLADLEERLGQPVVESEVELNATFDNYAIETGVGNLITDLMRDVADLDREIDVAIQNAGGIRSNTVYGPGEITGRNVMDILPFPNEIEVYEVTGETLRAYLENSVRPMPGEFGAQPAIQVSGLSYEWRGHDGTSQVFNVLVGGDPLDPEATYLVSTNDFVAGRSVLGDGELVLASGEFQGPYVKDRLEADFETVAPQRDHRIIRVDARVDQQGLDVAADTVEVTLERPDGASEIVADHFHALAPDGTVLEARSVTEADGAITVTFDRDPLVEVADADVEPRLRVLGAFDPDDEHYGYETDGETVDLPVSSGYDAFRLRAELDAAALLEAAGADATPTDTATDTDTATETATDDSTADGAGFGPLAALAGAGAGGYAARNLAGDDGDDAV